ncbi:MAG: hypothetical protein V3V75_02050, partial [Thermoguttaceae bacterium]
LVGQISTRADNANLNAELKQLVADALKPLADLDSAATQPADEWGTPVDGVQCRVKPAKLAMPGQTPRLEAFVRRTGKVDLLLSTVQTPNSRLIVDGRTYRHGGENLTGRAYHLSSKWQKAPRGFPVTLDNRWQSVEDGTPLSLTPGKHTIQYGWPGYYPMPGFPEKRLRPDQSKPILLMSNKVEIQIADPWGPKGTGGLQIRLVIPKATGETVPSLTDQRYFRAPAGIMAPRVRLELKNAGDKPIRLAEQNMNGGRKNILDEWLIGLSLDMQVGETVQRLTRTDNQGDFWSVIGNMPDGKEIKPGETVTLGLRVVKLADKQGQPLASLTGACRLRPVLHIDKGKFGLWHGTAQGKFVPVVIQDRGMEPADGNVVSEAMAATIRGHVKPLTVTAYQDIKPINRHRDWVGEHLQQAVPFLLEQYPTSPFVAGLLFDAWRQGLLTVGQKRLIAEGTVRMVAFEDQATSFIVGTRKVTLDITGVPMEKDWNPKTHPHIPWDILEAKLTRISVPGGRKADIFGDGKTQCSDAHFLRLREGLPEKKHRLDVVIEMREKKGEWLNHVRRHVDFTITPPVEKAFHFSETEGGDIGEGMARAMPFDPWSPQINRIWGADHKEEFALHAPTWKLTEPLPVDLCFTVEFTVQATGAVIKGEPLIIPRGKKAEGYFSPKDASDFWEKYNGMVPVTI